MLRRKQCHETHGIFSHQVSPYAAHVECNHSKQTPLAGCRGDGTARNCASQNKGRGRSLLSVKFLDFDPSFADPPPPFIPGAVFRDCRASQPRLRFRKGRIAPIPPKVAPGTCPGFLPAPRTAPRLCCFFFTTARASLRVRVV